MNAPSTVEMASDVFPKTRPVSRTRSPHKQSCSSGEEKDDVKDSLHAGGILIEKKKGREVFILKIVSRPAA
jgi:hypothetical protein